MTQPEDVRAIATRRKTTKRPTTKKKTASAATPAKAPAKPPVPAEGERSFILSIPFEERSLASAHGARYFTGVGWVYTGRALPSALLRYATEAYSWDRWMEDEMRGSPPAGNPNPDPSTGSVTLRPEQVDDVRLILAAHKAGAPEAMNGSDVGTGKTPVSVTVAKNLPNIRNILVVCPFSVMANWRSHLERMGDGGKRWCIINYESTKKLLEPPANAHTAKRARTKNQRTARHGTPKVAWDLVITDESHWLANPESQQTMTVDKIIAGPNKTPAFALRLSATAGSNPAQLSYLHRGIAWRTGRPQKPTINSDEYVEWCEANGFQVTRGRFGNALAWERNPVDLKKMHTLLFKGEPAWGLRRTPPWGEPQRIPLPVDLTADERDTYEREWGEFKAAMTHLDALRKKPAGPNPKAKARAEATARAKGLAAQVRYRQKAGQIKARGNALFVKDLLTKGLQVAISCEYIGTVEATVAALAECGIEAGTFTGQNRETREDDRLAFQRGERRVIVFTPAEGFNLQANDDGVSGASSAPRATLVAEPRWSPKKALQVEGRCHRDGELSPVYYSYAWRTIEEKVITTALLGMQDTKELMGDSLTHFAGLREALGVPMVLSD